ncbi:hypothetical protein R5R35_014701 [Gryllus longicercus]|uniref:G-protein coupled receptors family 2 profile 2 domain-containing protein n=1 Tax=Gryllus longicercus TaxID=2509291 RepID=A0AAN9VJN0_9ORTH
MTFWNVICVTVTLTICICVMLFPFIVPKLYTATMKLVMCHMTCEVLIYVFRTIAFAWGDLPMPLCKTYALTMQYLRLAGFFWINVMCIDMTSKFSGKMRAPSRGLRQPLCTKRFAYYSLHAWGWPAVIVAVTAALDLTPDLADHPLRPYIGDITCSFHSLRTALLYYYGVVILLVLVNIGLFMVTTISIYRTKQQVLDIISAMDNFQSDIQIANREDQRSLVMYLKIFCLMGLTYVTEIIAWYDGSAFTSILMDVNSILLSIFVFLLFCCKPQVMRNRLEELKQSWRSCCAARKMARVREKQDRLSC